MKPNDRCPEGGSTALTTAIRENNIEFVDLLLKHGANPAVRGQDWPLCMAVKSPIVLKRLLAFPGLNPRAFRGVVEMAVQPSAGEVVERAAVTPVPFRAGPNAAPPAAGISE